MTEAFHCALYAHDFVSWGGGIDFFRGLTSALHSVLPPDARLTLVMPHSTAESRLRHRLGPWLRAAKSWSRGRWQMPTYPTVFSDSQLQEAFSGLPASIDRVGMSAVRRHIAAHIEATRPSAALAFMLPVSQQGTPWLGYLWDFQYRHLPDFFSDEQKTQIHAQFAQILEKAPVVLVNSQDTKQDAQAVFPGHRAEVVALPFAYESNRAWFVDDVEETRSRYGIGPRYFIVCNQLWQHKDHLTAFRAMAELLRQQPDTDCQLVCTGGLHDFRHPDYLTQVQGELERLGLTRRVHLLGHIPKRDQMQLLLGSVAVVQPTRFEGGPGGGAAYDAIALGKTLLVSDIAVNRELPIDEDLHFFTAGDAARLALLMAERLAKPVPYRSLLSDAHIEGRLRRAQELQHNKGQAILRAVQLAMKSRH